MNKAFLRLQNRPSIRMSLAGLAGWQLNDADRFADWIIKFVKEASPHDPLPSKELLKSRAERWPALVLDC